MDSFISYSHRDERYVDRLKVHLKQLERDFGLTTWHDRSLIPGEKIDPVISAKLEKCGLFIAMLSPDFIASEYCYSTEMKKALELEESGRLRLVCVILEPCLWRDTPLSKYLALPKDGKEISEFTNENAAFLQVASGIKAILESQPIAQAKEEIPVSCGTPRERIYKTMKSKRRFDELDKSEFRDICFAAISDFFLSSLKEIAGVDGLESRFDPFENSSFTATIANRHLSRVASMTVHSDAGIGFEDIYFSYGERKPRGQSNGGFRIEHDDFEQFLRPSSFGLSAHQDTSSKCSPKEAAKSLFDQLLIEAGVDYA